MVKSILSNGFVIELMILLLLSVLYKLMNWLRFFLVLKNSVVLRINSKLLIMNVIDN